MLNVCFATEACLQCLGLQAHKNWGQLEHFENVMYRIWRPSSGG